jgi:hypothetical protein
MQRTLVVSYNVSGVPISPSFKCQAVHFPWPAWPFKIGLIFRHEKAKNYNLRCVTSQNSDDLFTTWRKPNIMHDT